jgi:hypothetical protein
MCAPGSYKSRYAHLVTPTTCALGGCSYSPPMDEDQVRLLIEGAIRDHEIRVAAISGVVGALLLVGTWHAIWLSR